MLSGKVDTLFLNLIRVTQFFERCYRANSLLSCNYVALSCLFVFDSLSRWCTIDNRNWFNSLLRLWWTFFLEVQVCMCPSCRCYCFFSENARTWMCTKRLQSKAPMLSIPRNLHNLTQFWSHNILWLLNIDNLYHEGMKAHLDFKRREGEAENNSLWRLKTWQEIGGKLKEGSRYPFLFFNHYLDKLKLLNP